jgi:type II secretory pathway pseudopilin PulG
VRAAGIGCLALIIVAFLSGLWIARLVTKNPVMHKVWSESQRIAQCQLQLQEIGGALDRYNSRNGKYPASLDELYPVFLEKKETLHCPSAPGPKDTPSYEYTPPDANTPADAAVAVCNLHVIIEGQPPLTITLLKNGTVVRKTPKIHGSPTAPK